MSSHDVTQLENTGVEELDRLPFGVAQLAADGTVRHLNRAEAARLGVQRWRAIGRNYFRDLAGSAAPSLSQAARSLAPGERTHLALSLAGYRWNREGTAVEVDLWRSTSGKLLLCVHPSA